MTAISLCMIVRDEAAVLPQFFNAVSSLWDELIVIDTGSQDDTVDVCLSYGAQVTHHLWQNDFSEARNVALAKASGRFVICLDADERVSSELVVSARKLAEDKEGTIGAASVRIVSDLGQGRTYENYVLRMWRNDPSIRYVHAIHEDITPALFVYLKTHNYHLKQLPGTVHHSGYTSKYHQGKKKKERDWLILDRCVQKNPDDLYAWYKILELSRATQDFLIAFEYVNSIILALGRAEAQVLRRLYFVGDMLVMLTPLLYHQESDQLKFLLSWEDKISPSAAVWLKIGELYEKQQQLVLAHRYFEKCLTLHGQTPHTQLASVRPLLGLSRLDLMRGNIDNALEKIRTASYENPRDPETLFSLVCLAHALKGEKGLHELGICFTETFGVIDEWYGACGERAFWAKEWQLAVENLSLAAANGLPRYQKLLLKAQQAIDNHAS